jgi:hypothetical protein
VRRTSARTSTTAVAAGRNARPSLTLLPGAATTSACTPATPAGRTATTTGATAARQTLVETSTTADAVARNATLSSLTPHPSAATANVATLARPDGRTATRIPRMGARQTSGRIPTTAAAVE